MSVQLLSSVDPQPEEEKIERAATAPPGSTDEARLDAVVAKAMESIPSAYDDEDERAPSKKKSLDTLIGEGLDKHEAAIAERKSFAKSKEARAELDTRYAKYEGASTAKTLDLFLDMADQLKANPREAGLNIAESYMRASRYVLDITPEAKAKPEVSVDGYGRRESGQKLNDIIENAQAAPAEKETFGATKEQRARLRQLWPDLSFDQAMNRIRLVDRRLHDDPLGAAAELAAAFGMGVTHRQREQEQQLGHLVQHIEQVMPQLDHRAGGCRGGD